MTGLKCFNVVPGFILYHSPNANTTLKANAPSLIATMLLGLDRGWIWDSIDVWSCFQNQHSASPSTTTFNQKDTFHHSYCILFSRSILTWLLYCTSITVKINCERVHRWTHFAPVESKLFESNDMPAQEYRCMSWLCQNDLLYRVFFFSFLWVYTCCCISKEGFGEESWNVGAKTQSTLFENHKGLGLKLIFVSIKFFKILICEILNQLLLSVIVMKLNFSISCCIYFVFLVLMLYSNNKHNDFETWIVMPWMQHKRWQKPKDVTFSFGKPQEQVFGSTETSVWIRHSIKTITNEKLMYLIELSVFFHLCLMDFLTFVYNYWSL